MHAPDRQSPYAHPARLILILSLAPAIGLGIGRFAYALVLPDMRDTLGWSYSAAGFMNTINAVGYLAGALFASRMIRRFGLPQRCAGEHSPPLVAGVVRHFRQFHRAELCAIARGHWRGCRIRRRRRAGGNDRAIAPRAGEFSAQPVLRRTRPRYPFVRPDRAVRAAVLWAGLMVDRLGGADAAFADHDRPAVARAVRRQHRDGSHGRHQIRCCAGVDLSHRLFPVRRRLHCLHDLHDRLCSRRRRRCGGAERILEPDRRQRFRDAMGVAPRLGARPRRSFHHDHSGYQRARRGLADLRAFAAVAGDFRAGVRRRLLRGGGIDHRFRALQLSGGILANCDRRDDDFVRHRPDHRPDRGRRDHRRGGKPVICAEYFRGDAGMRRDSVGVSEEIEDEIPEGCRIRIAGNTRQAISFCLVATWNASREACSSDARIDG